MRRRQSGLLALSAALAVGVIAPAAAGASTTLSYTTPGTYTFTVPDTVAKLTVNATGAGGGTNTSADCTPGQAAASKHPYP